MAEQLKNSDIETFVRRYGSVTESYKFYNGTETLRYDPVKHIYYRATPDALVPLAGVTHISHILDKSDVLMPWACKMMAEKIKSFVTECWPFQDGQYRFSEQELFEIIDKGKSAHKDELEDAGNVGSQAHSWIERFIKQKLGIIPDTVDLQAELLALDERAQRACDAALDWMVKHNVRWLGTEQKVYSRRLGYAGTMDGKCLVDSCTDPMCCPVQFRDRLTIADWKTSNYLYIEFLLQVGAYKQAHEEESGELIKDIWIIRLGKEDAQFEAWHPTKLMVDLGISSFNFALDLKKTVDRLKEEVNYIKDQIRAKEREERQAAKEAELKIKCKGADSYKGVRVPKCNGGNPCETCIKKYQERNPDKKFLTTE